MLMRFDPFAELDRLTQQTGNRGARPSGSFMAMDAYRSGDDYMVLFDVPGVEPSSIDLTVEHNMLTVSAQRSGEPEQGSEVLFSERPQGSFTRRVQLGDGLDVEHIEASYNGGVLSVRIPRARAAKPRKVEIATGAPSKQLSGGK